MKIPFKISSIAGGWSVCDYYNINGQFLSSVGIDPDMPPDDSSNKPCGYIRPTVMTKFSGANVDAAPLWILTNPKDNKIHVLTNNGKFISYTSAFASETLIATLATCSGNGAAYYDNYLYLARNADLGRYGPLNGTPALDDDWWTAVLTLTALHDTVYPSINGVEMPNHAMHRHTDDKLYFCDVNASNKGIINYVKTTKTTVEGDTNDTSVYNALDFDYGEYPVSIETYQTDLAIALIEGTDTVIKQMKAKLSFWDTSSSSYYLITSVELADPLITALKNVNGVLYVFSGFATGGCRVSKVVSGYSLEEVVWLPEEFPPISSGAVDHILNRFVWGSNTIEPEASGSVFAIGSKQRKFPLGLHNVARCSGSGASPIVTAVKYVQQNGKIMLPVIGWKDSGGYGLDKVGTTYANHNVIRLEVVVPEQYGDDFSLEMLRIPFAQAIAANMILKVYVYADDATNTPVADDNSLTTVNNANYSGQRYVKIYPKMRFKNNFFIQLEWEGTALLTVALPITGIIEIS